MLQSQRFCQTGIYTGETHEGHGKQTCGDEGNGHALHATGNVHQREVLADAGKYYQSKGETEGCSNSIDHAGEEVGLKSLSVVGSLCHKDGNAKDSAVGSNQGQEDA